MPDWKTPPTIVANKPVPALWSKYIWDNMEALHKPNRGINRGQRENKVGWVSTSSASFVDVNASIFTYTFTTTGRDLLIQANIWAYTTASDTDGAVTFLLDGVNKFNATYGFMYVTWLPQITGVQLLLPLFDVAAGQHTIKLQHRKFSGTGSMNTGVWQGEQWFSFWEI